MLYNTCPGTHVSALALAFCGLLLVLSPTECGASIIDACGDVCGIAIATSGKGQTHILTADIVQQFLAESPR